MATAEVRRESKQIQLHAAGAAEIFEAHSGRRLVEAGAARGGGKEVVNLVGEDAFAGEALAPFAHVEFAAANRAHTAQHAFLFRRHVRVEPRAENVFHRVGQAEDDVPVALRAGGGDG